MAGSKTLVGPAHAWRWLGVCVLAATVPCSASLAKAGGADKADGQWLVVEVGRVGQVVARLRILKKASIDKENWLTWEFDNQGKVPVDLRMAQYSITADCSDQSGKRKSFRRMGQGDAIGLLIPDFQRIDSSIRQAAIQPGVRSFAVPLSDEAGGSLGLPPHDGWLIKATITLTIIIRGGRLNGNDLPFPFSRSETHFQFEWAYPEKDGFKRLQPRLRDLLAKPDKDRPSVCMFHALLQIPDVTSGLSEKDFLAALDIYRDRLSSYDRQGVLDYLNKERAGSDEVLGHFRRQLEAGNPLAASDLLRADKIWSPVISDLLLRSCERDPQDASAAISAFFVRSRGKPADPAIAQRLSFAWLKAASLLGQKPANLPLTARGDWASQIETLGQTRDVKMISRLRLLLDDKTAVRDEANIKCLATGIPLTRACDFAMQAILAILGWSEHNVSAEFRAYEALGPGACGEAGLRAAKESRDKVIVALKKRLASFDPASDASPAK